YGFTDFMSDLKKPPQDPVVQNFIGLVKNANKIFKAFNYDLSTVSANHEKALERDRLGKMTDGLRNTAVLPIENFEPGPRFIPFAHRKVVGNTRYNDMTVGEVVEDMLRNLYNFLYIFRDQELTTELTSIPEKTRSMDAFKEQLARLGVNVEASSG
ncbi:MAG: hypothetical protein KDK27_09930, partial [Leptospiraceae bacterium]|nr:hypothetical protein [Leptospiraceae bacterium]